MIKTNEIVNQAVEITPCPACGNRLFKKRFTKKARDFWQCQTCRLEKIYPLPSLDELRIYYDESYSGGMYKTFTDADQMKRMTAEHRFKSMKGQSPLSDRWLDVGCSNGAFVKVARSHGINAEGIDLSAVAVEKGRAEGLPLYCSTIEMFNPGYLYNTIVAFDVLEHVLDPLNFLLAVRRLLEPGGTLVITVPNLNSLIRKIMEQRWYFYIPEEHLHYFHPDAIALLLSRAGYERPRCRRAYKPLTYNYSLTQFVEYNPLIYKVLNALTTIIPNQLRNMIVPLYIGEMNVITRSKL
jgi:2-polyprenyl-3-methyl-5-hydroxy-6-metoxy-1,4-benzoquinol methylase